MSSTFVTKVGLFQRCFTKLKVIVKSDEILLYNLLEYSGLAGSLLSFRTQAGWKRISRKRGQGIRKLTPKNVRVHRESALHLALSKEWISRTSLTAPKLFAS